MIVTHQLRDAFFIATHEAVKKGAGPDDVEFGPVSPKNAEKTEFVMLRDGTIAFEGSAAELRASTDPYLKAFLS